MGLMGCEDESGYRNHQKTFKLKEICKDFLHI